LNKKNSVRIFAIVIAALMILSLIYSAFYSMLTVHASNGITYYPIQYDHMVRIAKKFKFSSRRVYEDRSPRLTSSKTISRYVRIKIS